MIPRPGPEAGLRGLIHTLVNPRNTEQDRWLLRLALLQEAGVEPTPEALAFLGNTTIDKARGAMAVLQAENLAEFEEA